MTRVPYAQLACALCGLLGAIARAHAEPADSDATQSPTPAAEAAAPVATEPVPSPAPAAPTAPEDPAWTRAREQVARGEALFAVGNYDAALTEFVGAYRQLDGHPRQYVVLHNIALCHERMFRYDLALQFYERYLRDGGQAAEDRAEVAAVARALRGLLATLQVDSNVRAEVWVDNRRMGDAPGEVWLPAGRHVVELRAELRQPSRLEVQVGARETLRVRFDLQPLSNYRGLPPTYFWVGVGLSAAALGVGAILGANALDQSNSASELGPLHVEDPHAAGHVKDLALAADIGFGTAVVFGVTTTVLFFLTDWGDGEHEPRNGGAARARGDSPRFSPVASGEVFGGTLRGSF